MASVKIIKGRIRNIVDEALFEKIYKPNGWRLDEDAIEDENPIPKPLQTATQLKNYQKMKNKSQKHFDDKLFRSDLKE